MKPNITEKDNQIQKNLDNSYDLVIIVAGLAGLVAAFEVNQTFGGTKSILILEITPSIGGNSKKPTSDINMLSTPIQEKEEICINLQKILI